ncbi:hypothetical protein Hanom_Chr14g01291991 [Helianthus anomalus]
MYISREWSLFDFVDPPRHLALRVADRVLDEQEPDVLRVHLEQFLLPALPADSTAYVSPFPSVGEVVLPPLRRNQPDKSYREEIHGSWCSPVFRWCEDTHQG